MFGPVHSSWEPLLEAERETLLSLDGFLTSESTQHRPWSPSAPLVLRALQDPMERVRVLVLGQDPYPTAGHACGLSFSTAVDVSPLPRSLSNIFKELVADTGVPFPSSGDLTPWSDQGVLLLNRVLTVTTGQAGSHRGRGWESFTEAVLRELVTRGGPLVAVLWGRDAQSASPLLDGVPTVASAHPSPLSARRGFFGSRPFSRVNELLLAQGADPVNWQLP